MLQTTLLAANLFQKLSILVNLSLMGFNQLPKFRKVWMGVKICTILNTLFSKLGVFRTEVTVYLQTLLACCILRIYKDPFMAYYTVHLQFYKLFAIKFSTLFSKCCDKENLVAQQTKFTNIVLELKSANIIETSFLSESSYIMKYPLRIRIIWDQHCQGSDETLK